MKKNEKKIHKRTLVGFVPKVLRLGPGGGILLVVFDFVSGFIRKNILKE